MAKYITDLNVSLDQNEEQQRQSQGFKMINADLNKGAGGKSIYLWYKEGSVPITRIQFTFNEEMADGLVEAGYQKINKNLNAVAGGDSIYLWYFKGSGEYDTPIEQIKITTDEANEADRFDKGWERLACDLTRGAGGNWIHLWLKREKTTYICDVTATSFYGSDAENFKDGYIRVDENTNRATGGAPAFIWYRQTTDPKDAISDLSVSTTTSESVTLQQQNYTPLKVNLNEGTGGALVKLWYKKGTNNPIKAITLLFNTDIVQQYKNAGLTVVGKDLNTGSGGSTVYVCYYQ